MISSSELLIILGVTAIVVIPWVWAFVLALHAAIRRPSVTTILVAIVVLVGGNLVGVVYLTSRTAKNRQRHREASETIAA